MHRKKYSDFHTIKILCQTLSIDQDGYPFKCEKRLIEEAFNLHRHGKTLIVIIPARPNCFITWP